MNNNDFPTLELKRLNSSFSDPATEAEYQAWTIEDRLPIIRGAGWIAVGIWLIFPGLLQLNFPEDMRPILWTTYGLMIPLILASIGSSYVILMRPLVMPIASGVLSFSVFLAIWSGHTLTGGSSGATTGAMIGIMFATFMRVPAGWTLIALVPPAIYSLYLLFQQAGSLAAFDAGTWYVSGMPIAALATVFIVNLMHDRRTRCNYRDQRIIDLQKNQLEQAQSQIRRYIPPAVADQIIAGNEAAISEPKRQRVTVLFADIVGFTDIADRVEPEVMTEVLNDYMSAMADLIEQHGGTLNEFAGDGLMALFGAPEAMTPEDQARNAIQAAQAMQAKMPKLNEQWRKLGLGAELTTRIGINTGMVSVGSYGSQGRMTYTAIGLQTNIASRIESAAEPGKTLISDATWQLVSNEISCEPRGEVECKGVHFPIKVYSAPTGP